MLSEVSVCICTEMFERDPTLSCRVSQEMLGWCSRGKVWCCDKGNSKYEILHR